jgi:hypothetical protein
MTHRSFSIVAKDDKFGLAITTTYKKSSKGNKQIIYGYFSEKAANNDIEKLCQNETILPISRIFRFQRRARDFIRLYISPSLLQHLHILISKGCVRNKQHIEIKWKLIGVLCSLLKTSLVNNAMKYILRPKILPMHF